MYLKIGREEAKTVKTIFYFRNSKILGYCSVFLIIELGFAFASKDLHSFCDNT